MGPWEPMGGCSRAGWCPELRGKERVTAVPPMGATSPSPQPTHCLPAALAGGPLGTGSK